LGDNDSLKRLLEALKRAELSAEDAMRLLRDQATLDMGFARLDSARGVLRHFPEVVLAEGKTPSEVVGIVDRLTRKSGYAVVSRVDEEYAKPLTEKFPRGEYHARAMVFAVGSPEAERVENEGSVGVVTAGTSDNRTAEEAAVILELLNVKVDRYYDVGVAGIHRLEKVLPELRKASVLIVCAGMDAALPSVVGGLLAGPVIAVPTSTGYGAAFEGVSALLSVLNSCSPGVCVTNIDNGVGAAAAAVRLLRGSVA
jgi:hypothetical protein